MILNLEDVPEIDGVSSEINEILLNLVLNAIDAMPRGGRLEISTSRIEGAVRITVADSGTGMTDEVKEKCLQPFFTTKGSEGTGMGLAMVNALVTEYGGRMTIKSAAGEGTSIIVTLPYSPHQPDPKKSTL
jgi:signal transduction histidine kinase